MRIAFFARNIGVLLVAVIICAAAFANEIHEITNFSNGNAQIETICLEKNSSADKCIIALKKNGRSHTLMHYPFPPSNVGLSGDVFSILFPCGTGCAATFFYSEKNGLSKPFSLVLAANTKNGLVLSASNNSIYVYKIFQIGRLAAPISHIDLGLKSNADVMQSITGAMAEGDGFAIQYTGENGEERVFKWKNNSPELNRK